MRPGLVAVGVAFIVLGAGTLVAAYIVPSEGPSTRAVSTFEIPNLAPGQSRSDFVSLVNTSDGTLHFSWSSSVPFAVTLYSAVGCRNASGIGCNLGTPLAAWPSNSSGSLDLKGALVFPFLVFVSDRSTGPGSISASSVETLASGPPPLPALTALFVDAASLTLLVLGGLAIFLGLFLRGDVYGGKPPLISRSADDAEAIANLYDASPPPEPSDSIGPKTARSSDEHG